MAESILAFDSLIDCWMDWLPHSSAEQVILMVRAYYVTALLQLPRLGLII